MPNKRQPKEGMMVVREKGLHLACIMDGNGRWAELRGKPRLVGHRAGARRVKGIVRAAPSLGVKYLTIFAFSTENWKRSKVEVSGLMKIFGIFIERESAELYTSGVQVHFIGDRSELSPSLQNAMTDLEDLTAENEGLVFTIAINYGGRDEIVRASRKMALDVFSGNLNPDAINEDTVNNYLDTAFLPDPDLVIRTSGEQRISNFLLWQSAYAEYVFPDCFWPDFTPERLAEVIADYSCRERRFGRVPVVVAAE